MKQLLFLILGVFFSCSLNNKTIEIEKSEFDNLIKINQEYSKELYNYYDSEFLFKKEKNPFARSEITKWENISHDISNEFSKLDMFVDLQKDDIVFDSTFIQFQKIIFLLEDKILDSIDNPIQYENTSFFFENHINKDFEEIKKRVKNSNSKSSIDVKKEVIKSSFNYTKNKLLSYCLSIAPSSLCSYEKYSLIANTNKDIVLKGEDIRVIAGVGEFSNKTKPKFYINGEYVKYNEDLFVDKRIKAPNKKGEYKIHIKVIEENLNGKTEVIQKILKYNVVDSLCL
jgi:hypothetical protein